MSADFKEALGAYRHGSLTVTQLKQVMDRAIAESADGGSSVRASLALHITECSDTERAELNALFDGLPDDPSERSGTRIRTAVKHTADSEAAETRFRPPNSPPQSESRQPQTVPELGPGSIIGGRYRLVRELGHGGMGIVFLAESAADGQALAVKLLNQNFRGYPEAAQLLREEARKCLSLRHPNIVAVYPLERDGDSYCLPMEYLAGKTLRELLDEDYARGMPVAQAASIITAVGAALSYAHDHGVIHSDLKPGNIFITTGGSPRILDFGIARAIRADRNRFDPGSLGALTEAYASCEMLEGAAPDFRDDIYGLACVIYELLTGVHPFGGRSAVEARAANLRPVPVRTLTEVQNGVLSRGLAFLRAERSASVEDLASLFSTKTIQRSRSTRMTWAIVGCGAVAVAIALGGWWSFHMASPSKARSDLRPGQTEPMPQTTTRAAVSRPELTAFSDCAACPTMIVLPAGTFRMSSSREEMGRAENEFTQRLVRFRRPLAMSKAPITRGQFRAFLDQTGRAASARCLDVRASPKAGLGYRNPGFPQTDDQPAVCISADDGMAYADWLNRIVGKNVYRLPSEAEWEFAARAGTRTAYAWGDTESDACRYGNFGDQDYEKAQHAKSHAPCADGYAYTAPVGSFPSNGWDLQDMVGNVRVWTRGCSPPIDPHGIDDGDSWIDCEQQFLTARGAGFATPLGDAATRFAVRLELPRNSTATSNEMGFRVVRTE